MATARMRASRSGRIPAEHKRALFIAHYLIHLNAAQAAIAAGYSKKTAKEAGARLLTDAHVQRALSATIERRMAKAELTADRVLEELRRLAFADHRKFFDAKGNLLPIVELDDEAAAALAGFEVIIKNAAAGDGVTDVVHKIKTYDKTKALDILAKHFGLVREVHEHHHRVTLEALVAGSMDEIINVTPTATS